MSESIARKLREFTYQWRGGGETQTGAPSKPYFTLRRRFIALPRRHNRSSATKWPHCRPYFQRGNFEPNKSLRRSTFLYKTPTKLIKYNRNIHPLHPVLQRKPGAEWDIYCVLLRCPKVSRPPTPECKAPQGNDKFLKVSSCRTQSAFLAVIGPARRGGPWNTFLNDIVCEIR